MRHKISGRKLNRKTSHRIALLKNLAKSLIINEQIETTLPKAKDLRPFVEKILHSGKNNNLHSRRKVFSFLRDNLLVNKVFDVLAKRYANRNGGYIQEFSDLGSDMVMQLRRQLLNWLIEMYQQKGIVIKKELKSKKNIVNKKQLRDKVVNEETKIKAKEKNSKQVDDKSTRKKSKLKFKKTRKGF